MTKEEFRQLFEAALETAAKNAEQQLGQSIPHWYRVQLHGAKHAGDVMTIDAAVHALYLGEDRFYRIIDVAITGVSRQFSTAFVRASAHKPSSFEDTWNEPPGSGPFKQLIAEEITITSLAP
jgi:hypothetical protein